VTSPAATPTARPRLAFIDALRGLAAVSVMLYHFCTGGLSLPALRDGLPELVVGALGHGWLGVQTFFVLSGFVIAYAIGDRPVTPRGAALFALRRQVRLDPPYWASIVFAAGHAWRRKLLWGGDRTAPSATDILANVLYLQEILQVRAVQAVYWTLCIEVQLYLTFAVMLAALDRHARAAATVAPRVLTAWVVFVTGAWSLDAALLWRARTAWVITHWYLFAMGVCTWYALAGHLPRGALLAGLLGASIASFQFDRIEPAVGAAVAAVVYLVGRRDALATLLSGRVWQWLGRLSYSVYLVHTVAGAISRGMLRRPWLERSVGGVAVIVVCAMSLSFALAWLLHVTVERRAIAWASRIRWQDTPDTKGDDAAGPVVVAPPP
jgi:hypothetical protein